MTTQTRKENNSTEKEEKDPAEHKIVYNDDDDDDFVFLEINNAILVYVKYIFYLCGVHARWRKYRLNVKSCRLVSQSWFSYTRDVVQNDTGYRFIQFTVSLNTFLLFF